MVEGHEGRFDAELDAGLLAASNAEELDGEAIALGGRNILGGDRKRIPVVGTLSIETRVWKAREARIAIFAAAS